MITSNISLAATYLKRGEIIAYPTEAVFGLGCDPLNEAAVLRLLELKNRPVSKGLIIVASSWRQINDLIQPIAENRLALVQSTWPGPITWVFPAQQTVPKWLSGAYNSIAVRLSNHPLVAQLCDAFGGPIVSTSANLAGEAPAKTSAAVADYFHDQISLILAGELGDLAGPTPIFDAVTGDAIR